ncbi:uncharacterized protein UTRI_03894 [Ustilago trichophora]|uniref:Beta-glucuronidase C-terminal domain-containing protein n=1 Tax=Ustilago trichophora TaxID=86804 RepID=A0A5C3E8A6_9BASI|nr:uncharacterized protein UTRI_03894 [Ustilago trichophora]
MRIVHLSTPLSIDKGRLAAYAFYNSANANLQKLALLNMNPHYYNNNNNNNENKKNPQQQTQIDDQQSVYLDISTMIPNNLNQISMVKRKTAAGVDEMDSNKVTWAGQSFTHGKAQGQMASSRSETVKPS